MLVLQATYPKKCRCLCLYLPTTKDTIRCILMTTQKAWRVLSDYSPNCQPKGARKKDRDFTAISLSCCKYRNKSQGIFMAAKGWS